ncbi:MAG: glycoside hydrolase family 3 protein [Clostridia bacterium]|nr:glycoside hydrolase family 3 protein [Clostridia bacterium]
MDIEKIISQMTLEEKALIVTGAGSMETYEIARLGVPKKTMSDGPLGVRTGKASDNCTSFPGMCSLGASWDRQAAFNMGKAIGDDCVKQGVGMILGPGMNIKRTPLCGRNFEYFSEDPLLAGEMAAGYVSGVQSTGVSACPKHFALNNQEENRLETSVEVDERVMREIYLRAFEIMVKKSHPDAIMCAYNKINSIWCSENKYLLTDTLKDEWGFDGVVVSDWGAVHDSCRAISAGLDLEMPQNRGIIEEIRSGIESGKLSIDALDGAVRRVLEFVSKKAKPAEKYDRDAQHKAARDAAAAGIVLLKNDRGVLPLTREKYDGKKIAVVGEFAKSPVICGQGSAEVATDEKYIDSPLDELKLRLPNTQIDYFEMFKKREFSANMLWPQSPAFRQKMREYDAVVIFVGDMESENTEKFDKRTIKMNYNYDMFVEDACKSCKNVAAVIQSGSAVIIDDWWNRRIGAIVEMWLGGEGAGGAVADVLCGVVNPSGKLPETFPKVERRDLDFGDITHVEYSERLDVGYRYYDRHPDEILYPFGHGLSYTTFEYSDLDARFDAGKLIVDFTLKNTGELDGAEVWQIYVGDVYSTLSRPIKELRAFDKVFLRAGEQRRIHAEMTKDELGQFNVFLRRRVSEEGIYDVFVGASSRDIRLCDRIALKDETPYSVNHRNEDMIG